MAEPTPTHVPTTIPPGQPAGFPPPAVALPGGYEALEELGRGGMGVVYKARDGRLNRTVAVKQMQAKLLHREGLARFRREAEALAALRHPHVVQVHAWEDHPESPCIVMEYVAGGTLEGRLAKAPMPPAEAARLVAILARAVQHAHEQGVVHRDLKPANVLMGPAVEGSSGTVLGGFPRVADFGLARLLKGEAQTATGAAIGTPHYMAPEQAAGRTHEVGPATDVWALGVILYRCLAGKLPFVGDSVLATLEVVKTAEPAPLTGVPAEVAAVCEDCLCKAPGERPTAREVAERLEALARGKEVPRGSGKRPSRWWIMAGLGFLVLGAVAAGIVGNLDRTAEKAEGATVPEAETKPLRIRPVKVELFEKSGKEFEAKGLVGDLQSLPFSGLVKVEVEFSEPVHAYVLAFNPNGKEQLLYPAKKDGKGDETIAPPQVGKLDVPTGDAQDGESLFFPLNDELRGGLQVFAVAASRKPLSPYAEWKRRRGETGWRRITGIKSVWAADLQGMYRMQKAGGNRGDPVAAPDGRPQLGELLRALGRGVEAVEVIAFPVRAEGEQP